MPSRAAASGRNVFTEMGSWIFICFWSCFVYLRKSSALLWRPEPQTWLKAPTGTSIRTIYYTWVSELSEYICPDTHRLGSVQKAYIILSIDTHRDKNIYRCIIKLIDMSIYPSTRMALNVNALFLILFGDVFTIGIGGCMN